MSWNLSAFADEAGNTCEEQIKALQRAGYKFIDIRGINNFNITTLPTEQAKLVRPKLDAAGIKVNMFGSPLGKIDITDDFNADLTRLRHLGELAPIFNCQAVRIFSYYNKTHQPKDKWQAESLKRLAGLRAEAQKLGLVLYHENELHILGDHPDDVALITKELRDGQSFRMIFDFSNYSISKHDVWKCWEQLRDTTDAFHLKDNDQNQQFVLFGQGLGYAKEILADVLKRGWQGPLTLEPHLTHSSAVLATGPTGSANQAYNKMTPADSFHAAAVAARTLLESLRAPLA